jgi:hypothetical protein
MVGIWLFGWLVFDSPAELLTTENCVSLNGVLVVKPFPIQIRLAIGCHVQQLERRSRPKVVATINKLVNSTVEPSFNGKLSLSKPL